MKILKQHAGLLLLSLALAFGCSKPAERPAEAATTEAKPIEIKRTENGDVVVTIHLTKRRSESV